ncbi:hypothetical protein ACIHAX_16400 [Nocardia sp. NPDC051929]|uniref:hypothetical protein n=1 Tax=Nocardia sp. NPDC051929 TaxID=3364327 RepID=UPI0037C9C291
MSLLLGAMRFRTPPKEAAEALAPEVTLPDMRDYVRWATIVPPNGSLGAATPQEAVLSRMPGRHPDLRALIEQADTDNSSLLSIRVVEPGERWAPGPVTLLGDAIHATSPTGGNDANTACATPTCSAAAAPAAATPRRDRRLRAPDARMRHRGRPLQPQALPAIAPQTEPT